ncbi:MAG: hypothetical protein ACFFD4_14500 [Candidatus Odinarchaeota archaeon]
MQEKDSEKAKKMEEKLDHRVFTAKTVEERALLLVDLVFRACDHSNGTRAFETRSFKIKTWIGRIIFKDCFPSLLFPQPTAYVSIKPPSSITRQLIITSKEKTGKKFLFFKYKTCDTYKITCCYGKCTDISPELAGNPRLFSKIEQEIFTYIENKTADEMVAPQVPLYNK